MMSAKDGKESGLRGKRQPIYVGGFRPPSRVDVIVCEYSSEHPSTATQSAVSLINPFLIKL